MQKLEKETKNKALRHESNETLGNYSLPYEGTTGEQRARAERSPVLCEPVKRGLGWVLSCGTKLIPPIPTPSLSREGKRAAFTLAEVLITLGIIGIVAALTIPGLINKINEKVTSTQKTVIERKLVESLNMLSNKENGLNVTYNNTEEFVKALSKYLKVTTICGKNDLQNCFPYEKINYDKNGENKTVDVSSLTTGKKFKLEGNWLDTAGFIMANGTPFIISYNNDCGTISNDKGQTIVDPDRPLKDIPYQCIDGIYDNNGTRSPNKFGKDVKPLLNAQIGAEECKWSEWFDVTYPRFKQEPEGDFETYENIRAAGGDICAQPKNIECRAENYPEYSLEDIGQVVSCDVNSGLVCHNSDQNQRFQMCFNYQIRVQCCE